MTAVVALRERRSWLVVGVRCVPAYWILRLFFSQLSTPPHTRRLYALGGNEAATRLSEYQRHRQIIVYSLWSAGIAGIIEVAHLSAQPGETGYGWSIAAVVDGTQSGGWKVARGGTLIGVNASFIIMD